MVDVNSRSTGPTPKSMRVHADAAAKASKAWALRVAGGSWAEIASIVGFSDDTAACRAVKNYFGELPQVDREEARAMWRARHELLWRKALEDVNKGKPGGVRAGVAVMRSASLLDGLDQPHRIEVTDPTANELGDFVRQLARVAGANLPMEGNPFNDEIEEGEVIDDD